MSVIQRIRDKAAWLVFGAIGVSLIAFIVQDAFSGRGSGWFGGQSTTLGKVNGKEIDIREFEQKYKQAEEMYSRQGYPMNEMMRNNIRESLWNEFVDDAVYSKEMEKLGIQISKKETGDILYGANPPQDLKQQFTDKNTGVYDANAAYQAIRGLKKNSPEYKNFWGQYVPALEKQRQREKYMTLLTKSVYTPKWMTEKRNAENSQMASISYVNVPYMSIPDSTIKVTDEDIRSYIEEHKKEFKQENASRGIYYVSFDASASKKDSSAIYDQLQKLKDSFAVTPDIKSFLLKENSQTPYYESNIHRKEIKIPAIDTIIKTPVGGVFGPYIDGGSYALARMVDVRQWPDTVKARHILIATEQRDPQSGQTYPVRFDTTAKRIADSIELAIRGGADFDSLCTKYSDDPGSKEKGGVYENMVTGSMVAPFNDFVFGKPVGSKGVVKTDFGYHYIEILSQKGSSPAYKIAYLARPIAPSNETDNIASGAANQFAGESRTAKAFGENIVKRKYNKLIAADIKPLDDNIMGIGSNRQLVKWIYEADKGDVSEPFSVGDKYVVVMVSEINEKGLMSVAKARPMVEFKIRNQKKAQQIIKKIGNAATLDAVSKTAGQPVLQLDSIQFSAGYIPNLGPEMKVIGAAFNKANQAKVSGPIAGEMGVFYIKVNSVSAVANSGGFDFMQQQQMAERMGMGGGYGGYNNNNAMDALKKAATIKDNRAEFF
ncbi:MAG TPA: SurA N-terminal domain-containing protein [Chitinophagaceae bacterium]|nr:SurA N-terminal domain-containing protein [Chitinophagaceae bacterium]